ncbi:MAG: hypothetical protein HY303_20305 [Candidatus Wallbacteria bacterium]|nr:hypothetical protein [Candidatus Wallbacteria bacterium]
MLFCVVGGLFAGLVCQYPYIVWWGNPVSYLLRQLFDLLVGWTLAGLVLAKLSRPD